MGEGSVKKRIWPLCGQKRKSLFQTVSWAVTQGKQRGDMGNRSGGLQREEVPGEERGSELVEEMGMLGNV